MKFARPCVSHWDALTEAAAVAVFILHPDWMSAGCEQAGLDYFCQHYGVTNRNRTARWPTPSRTRTQRLPQGRTFGA